MLKHVLSSDGFKEGDNIGKISGSGDSPSAACEDGSTLIGDTIYITVYDNTRLMRELLDEAMKCGYRILKD